MISESNDEMAWRLAWSSQWRLQQESRHIEPTLPKMIGHLSVYNHVFEYMHDRDVSNEASPEYEFDTDVGQVENIILGADDEVDDPPAAVGELSHLLPPVTKDNGARPTRPTLVRSSSVVVTAVEIDDDEAEAEAKADGNPFDDDEEEETSSHGDGEDDDDYDDEDDDRRGGWSSDDEAEFDSVSSVEDEAESQDSLASKLSTIDDEESASRMEALLNGRTP